MHMRSRLALCMASVPLAVAAIFITAPTASADGAASFPGARVTFVSNNEVFRLYDTACDGHAVRLEFKLGNDPTILRRHHSDGCNTSHTWDESFTEGKRVSYRACVNSVGCGGWTDDEA